MKQNGINARLSAVLLKYVGNIFTRAALSMLKADFRHVNGKTKTEINDGQLALLLKTCACWEAKVKEPAPHQKATTTPLTKVLLISPMTMSLFNR